ncbi:MAG: hypothetical protein M0P01_13660, partial [Treponema sp.]|nr:hypothetical protein [Treponema sp.]
GANMAKIAELESSRMNDGQNLADVRITYRQYVQYLKEACGTCKTERSTGAYIVVEAGMDAGNGEGIRLAVCVET